MKKFAFLLLFTAAVTSAQMPASRESKPDAEKIASALQAGPKFVTQNATVIDAERRRTAISRIRRPISKFVDHIHAEKELVSGSSLEMKSRIAPIMSGKRALFRALSEFALHNQDSDIVAEAIILAELGGLQRDGTHNLFG